MQYTAIVASSLALASGALAQQNMDMKNMGSSASTMMMPSGTSSGASATGSVPVHIINVSDKNGSLVYSPMSTTVPKGEMVQWHFYPMNHSVVQAAFSNPCEPIGNVMSNMTTFYSGYMPVAKTDTMMPALTMMVKDDKPFWYYCSQGKHCQSGMVGVINPPKPSTGKTIEKFAETAKSVPKSSIPTNDTTTSGTSSSSSSSSSDSGSSSSSSNSSPSSADSSSSSGNSSAPNNSSSSSASGTPSPSPSTFPGAGNNLVTIGFTTFVGLGLAFLL